MYLDYSKAVYLFQVYNIRLVKYYVSLYFKDWHITDLEQCGMIGLTEAIFKFDIRRCIHFCSYAYFNIKRAKKKFELFNRKNVFSNMKKIIETIKLNVSSVSEMITNNAVFCSPNVSSSSSS